MDQCWASVSNAGQTLSYNRADYHLDLVAPDLTCRLSSPFFYRHHENPSHTPITAIIAHLPKGLHPFSESPISCRQLSLEHGTEVGAEWNAVSPVDVGRCRLTPTDLIRLLKHPLMLSSPIWRPVMLSSPR